MTKLIYVLHYNVMFLIYLANEPFVLMYMFCLKIVFKRLPRQFENPFLKYMMLGLTTFSGANVTVSELKIPSRSRSMIGFPDARVTLVRSEFSKKLKLPMSNQWKYRVRYLPALCS